MIQIDEMILRLPGISEEEGRQLGLDVAQRLAANAPDYPEDQHLGALNLQLSLSPSLSREQISDAIASQILGQLQTPSPPNHPIN
ncbi:MAG: hypothetical protein KIPDCIKN_00452 [Haliscomenobacter sp.]|jgi:hypothetical protein|nr:hypothetical protein [Haliscomenobacter sp.]